MYRIFKLKIINFTTVMKPLGKYPDTTGQYDPQRRFPVGCFDPPTQSVITSRDVLDFWLSSLHAHALSSSYNKADILVVCLLRTRATISDWHVLSDEDQVESMLSVSTEEVTASSYTHACIPNTLMVRVRVYNTSCLMLGNILLFSAVSL